MASEAWLLLETLWLGCPERPASSQSRHAHNSEPVIDYAAPRPVIEAIRLDTQDFLHFHNNDSACRSLSRFSVNNDRPNIANRVPRSGRYVSA